MKVVVTGTAGCGKSTLVEKTWYKVIPEVAREWLSFLKEHSTDSSQTRDFVQNLIEINQIKNWVNSGKEEHTSVVSSREYPVIFDRSLVDEIAYRRYYGLEVSPLLIENCKNKYRYDKIFFLPFWEEIYVNDHVRLETKEEAKKISDLLEEAYIEMGYELIYVPKLDKSERLKWFLEEINKDLK